MSKPRVAVAEIWQESTSFLPIETTLEDFESFCYIAGEPLLAEHASTLSVVAGFIDGAEANGFELEPLLSASAQPGGPLTEETFRTLRDELVARLERALPLDGVLLSLHGAMLAAGTEDPDGDLVHAVRAVIGDIPMVVVLDLHANVSERIVDGADVIVGYKEHPHVDVDECGRRAADHLALILRERPAIYGHLVKLPMLEPGENESTEVAPHSEIQALRAHIAEAPGCLELTGFLGYGWGDVPQSGTSVLAYSTTSAEEARDAAWRVAGAYWERRAEFRLPLTSAEDAVDLALRSTNEPVILLDRSDNTRSGGAGDTTTMLRLLLERDVERAVVAVIYDPAAVEQARTLGVGGWATFALGGKIEPRHGGPVHVEAVVRRVGPVAPEEITDAVARGLGRQPGDIAVLSVNGLSIVVSEKRVAVTDAAILRVLGIEPLQQRLISLKEFIYWRQGFAGVAGDVVQADAPGCAYNDFTYFEHQHVRRPIEPYDAATLADARDHAVVRHGHRQVQCR